MSPPLGVTLAPPVDRSHPMAPVSPPPPAGNPAPSRPSPALRGTAGARPILLTIVGVLLSGAVLASFAWRLSGGGEYTIATASMCPDLCVGTLVLDRPLVGQVQPGMVVTFRPPGVATLYTHRVVKVRTDGSFETAGDALGKVDPWTVPRSRVVGRVVAYVRGLGWLWQCLPEMAAAFACYLVARRGVRRWVRSHTDFLFVVVMVAVPVLTVRPLLRSSVIAIGEGKHTVALRIANTGLLPARLELGTGQVVPHLAAGHLATLAASTSSAVWLRETVSFSPWQWAIAGLVLALPVLVLIGRLLRAHRVGPGPGDPPGRGAPVPTRAPVRMPAPATATLVAHAPATANPEGTGAGGPPGRAGASRPAGPRQLAGLGLLATGAEGAGPVGWR